MHLRLVNGPAVAASLPVHENAVHRLTAWQQEAYTFEENLTFSISSQGLEKSNIELLGVF